MTREPIINAALITTGLTVAIDLALAYGVAITDAQQAAWRAAAAFVAPLIVAIAARRSVVPVDRANEAIDTAAHTRVVKHFTVGQQRDFLI